MPHIIGTAGHIDHGKTALIRALTGQDTDRLKEEKERGISIDLGFAYMDLGHGERAGIVDVPGHERFIRNMLAGAHGIDLVLLVVAADDGVMPQTEEHLDILHLLGATHGVVAITKTDLVDAKRLAEVQEEIAILLAGTALEGAPVVPVSSTTGTGIEALRHIIEAQLAAYQRLATPGYFRLPVDRAFVMHGHGIVVTGTAIAGSVRVGDALRLLPGGEVARLRSLQVHGAEVSEATAGQRVAMNLAGIERATVRRGHVVCDVHLDRVTDRFDAWIELRTGAGRPIQNHTPVRVYAGTAEALGKLILLDGREELPPRLPAYAQIVVREPVAVLRGDRFILRDASAQRTIGGGVIVDAFARRHRRGEHLAPRLDPLRLAPTADAAVAALLALDPDFAVSPDALAQAAAMRRETLRALLPRVPGIRLLPDSQAVAACTTVDKWEVLRAAVVRTLTAFHGQAPLVPGMEMESVRSQVAPDVPAKIFRAILDALIAGGVVRRDDSAIRLPAHRVALQRDEQQLAERAESALVSGGFAPPDLKQIEAALQVPRQRLSAILQQLEREGRVTRIADGLYFAREPLDRATALLRQHATQHGSIDAATFRDLLGASRKFSIALLDYFDRTGVTLRIGDIRKLRE